MEKLRELKVVIDSNINTKYNSCRTKKQKKLKNFLWIWNINKLMLPYCTLFKDCKRKINEDTYLRLIWKLLIYYIILNIVDVLLHEQNKHCW